MKELKRISAFFMAMLMMLTVFSAFSAVSAEGEAAGGTQPVWPAQGSIKLDKDAAAVEGAENLWEITLGIQGKNFETTSDVVLAIDNSNSMYENDRMVQTKAAANAFVDALLTQDSATALRLLFSTSLLSKQVSMITATRKNSKLTSMLFRRIMRTAAHSHSSASRLPAIY